MSTQPRFRAQITEENRAAESKRILEKYPERVPCIVERNEDDSSDLPEVDKKKYLVPRDLTVGQFMYVIRKRLRVNQEQAIFYSSTGMCQAALPR